MSLKGDQSSFERVVHKAIDYGINYFDTADLYENGENERKLGLALQGQRDRVIIATKVGNQMRADGSGWDWNPGKDYILQSVDSSLRRLRTDYIDVYQLHGGTMEDPIDETIEAFELLKQAGKIRCYGISSIRPPVIHEYLKRSHLDSEMLQYSLLDRRLESTLDLLKENQVAVMVRGALAQGLLVNKPAKPYLDLSEQEVKKASEAIQSVSGDKRSKSQTAILWTLHHSAVSSVVVGLRTPEQLEDAVGVFKVPALSETEFIFLRDSVRKLTLPG